MAIVVAVVLVSDLFHKSIEASETLGKSLVLGIAAACAACSAHLLHSAYTSYATGIHSYNTLSP